jgi:hypothetical protein
MNGKILQSSTLISQYKALRAMTALMVAFLLLAGAQTNLNAQAGAPAYVELGAEQLDQLVAPIALYPDSLSRLAIMPRRTPGPLGQRRPTVTAAAAMEREALTLVRAAGHSQEATARCTRAGQRSRGAASPLTQTAVRRPRATLLRLARMVGRSREAASPLAQTAVRRPETVSLPRARIVGRSREATSPLIPRKQETTSRRTWAAVHRPGAAPLLGWEAERRGATSPQDGWVAAGLA